MSLVRASFLGCLIVPVFAFAVRADSVVLSGPDSLDGSYSSSAIAAEATPSNTVSYNGLTGVSLWSFLGGSDATLNQNGVKYYGAIATTPQTNGNPNSDLRYYVTATSSSGAQSVVSLGSIDPGFAGTSQTAPFVAYQTSSGTPLSTPVLVVPNGPSGATIQNLTSLQISSVAAPAAQGGGVSSSVTVSGNVTSPGSYSSFPGTATVTIGTETYSGVALATFLNVPSAINPNTQLVAAIGTDGYEVVYSLDELLNADGTANLNDILADAASGSDFTTGGDGIARTILAGDANYKHGRYVSNLADLEVLSATPLPAGGSLFMSGLGMLVLFGWYQDKKKNVNAGRLQKGEIYCLSKTR